MSAYFLLLIALVAIVLKPIPNAAALSKAQTAAYWRQTAQQYITAKLRTAAHPNLNRARNIILFMGDGMSQQTVAAARMYLGGEEHRLSFEDFPHFGLAKTYAVNHQVSDSANTATAYLSGVKSTYGTIGVNGHVALDDCVRHSDRRYHTESIAGWAQKQCKATGLVTTARVTHASPAGVYAHTANRDWENDAAVSAAGCDPRHTADVARQLIEDPVGGALKVVLGCGGREFRDRGVAHADGYAGVRTDGRDLIAEWRTRHTDSRTNGSYVWTRDQLLAAAASNATDYLLGIFGVSHCPYHGDLERQNLTDSVPSLTDMTLAAVKLLDREPAGYFLFVESARIDHAHHHTLARRAMEEVAEFDRVIDLVRLATNESDTLLVVTADHSHVMSYNGYSKRGNDILGLASTPAGDGMPYPTLSYANGPGFYNTYTESGQRWNYSADGTNFSDANLAYMAMVPMDDETHGGDDVGVFASGPWAHLFTGNYEQNNIPVAMAYAARIGMYAEAGDPKCSAATALAPMVVAMVVCECLVVAVRLMV